jgi:hypothetical protein
VSGLPGVALTFLGLVCVATLCALIMAVRRDHAHHVHTLWYVFSLTLCSVSVLFFYIHENARTLASTPLNGTTAIGQIVVILMKASMDVREELYILATLSALLILPQVLSYLISGIFGCGSPPILVSTISRIVTWSLIKFFCVLSGILAAQSIAALYAAPLLTPKEAPVRLVEAAFMIALSFATMVMYYDAEALYRFIANRFRLKRLGAFNRFMTRFRERPA